MTKTVVCVDMDGKEYRAPVDSLSWRPSAYGVVIKDGCVLVSEQFGGFVLPGGGLDLGELPEEAVIREIKEETGIAVTQPVLVGAESTFFKLPESHQGGFIQSILLYYACTFVGGELSNEHFTDHDQKHTGMPQWLPLEKVGSVKMSGTIDWRKYVQKSMV